MSDIAALVAGNLDIWTSATQRKSGAGRGGGKRISLYGIERLRALILDLAVLGKLVPQDAGDEPASELLTKLTAEKRKIVGATKKSHIIGDARQLFPLPKGWVWVRLGELAELITSGSRDWSKYLSNDGAKFVTMGNLSRGGYEMRLEKMHFVQIGSDREGTRTSLQAGDLLISITGDVGNMALIPTGFGEAYINQHTAMIRFLPSMQGRFVPEVLRSPLAQKQFNEPQRGVKNSFRLSDIQNIQIPLPPLAEQRRIVAKVDELMALCDALERESADAMAAHQALVEELLATLVNSADAAELAANWARLESHFDTLFTTDASIEALKQTILDLAVRGKLVEQDAADEAASEFLAKIDKAKKNLFLTGVMKKGKAFEPIDVNALLYAIPENWVWRRLGDVSYLVTDGEHITPKRIDDPNAIPLVTAKNVRAGQMDYTITDFVSRETAEICWQRCQPQENDILLVSVGATIGRHTIVRDYREMVIVRSVTLIKADHDLIPYLSCVIGSQMMQKQIWGGVRQSAQPCLYLNVSNALQIPIPPLAEQRRIVAKVDALMALCDALKARLADAAQTQRHLADAITERAAA